MAWENLPMRDRATIIRLGVQSGLRDMNSIKETYNKYAEGGNINDNTRVTTKNKGWAGLDSAINRGDTIHMTSPQEAEWFTTHYKNYYPNFNKY